MKIMKYYEHEMLMKLLLFLQFIRDVLEVIGVPMCVCFSVNVVVDIKGCVFEFLLVLTKHELDLASLQECPRQNWCPSLLG